MWPRTNVAALPGAPLAAVPLIDDVITTIDIERFAGDQPSGIEREERRGGTDIVDAHHVCFRTPTSCFQTMGLDVGERCRRHCLGSVRIQFRDRFSPCCASDPWVWGSCRRLRTDSKRSGLSEYAARFAENRTDFSVLRDLTDQDLKDLGVVLGDRRKILARSANSTRPRPRRPQPRPGRCLKMPRKVA
jgi:uncharacterized protein YjiS (DUF1127 family)